MVKRGQGQAIGERPPGIVVTQIARWIHDYTVGAALSQRFKSAFRVALAMVITYVVSLAMDWDKTFWAALSLIFCSLATAGGSLNASIDRIAGTAVVAVLALLLAAACTTVGDSLATQTSGFE